LMLPSLDCNSEDCAAATAARAVRAMTRYILHHEHSNQKHGRRKVFLMAIVNVQLHACWGHTKHS